MGDLSNKEKYVLLNTLFNLFLDTNYEDKDDELSEEEKLEIHRIVEKNVKLFRQLRTHAKAELNTTKHHRVLEFLADLQKGLRENIAESKKMADEIFATKKFTELQPMFRNLNAVSEQDKKAILMDDKLLDLLGEIEEKYNKKDE